MPRMRESIWLARRDGSKLQQVAGPLRPPSDLSELEQFDYIPYYGYTDWSRLFDWHRAR